MAITFPSTTELTTRLDDIEARLPGFPARLFKLQRAVTAANYDRTVATFEAITESARTFLGTASTSGKTVTGQARAAVEDLLATLRVGVSTVAGQAVSQTRVVADRAVVQGRTVAGQASAQGRKVTEAAEAQANKLVDEAIDAVEDAPGSGTPYEQWTKAELVERAKELHIVGPTRMSKAELIATLRAA